MKRLLFFLIFLWGGGALGYWYWNQAQARPASFRTVPVERGDLQLRIEATGTIEPVEVVDIGAQVAGLIQTFGLDPTDSTKTISYGTPVEEGTVLARLDDSLFRARVEQSEAQQDRAKAELLEARAKLRRAERELTRSQSLRTRGAGMISEQELDNSLSEQEVARAGAAVAESAVAVAAANLDEARVNLGYTTIRSPVKGVILDRRVNIGQTVVASLNAPSLFLIARDLSRLEIWASVNEADIGAIRPGLAVRFTVGARPDEGFKGRVSQIRLNASMIQNVVTYTVVVDCDNADGRLLPYLTARLQFEVDVRRGVLLVPNAALRFRPRPEHVVPEAAAAYASSRARRGRDGAEPGSEGTLWVQDGDLVRPVPVEVGPSDGMKTEVRAKALDEGRTVVVGQEWREAPQSFTPFLPKFETEKRKP